MAFVSYKAPSLDDVFLFIQGRNATGSITFPRKSFFFDPGGARDIAGFTFAPTGTEFGSEVCDVSVLRDDDDSGNGGAGTSPVYAASSTIVDGVCTAIALVLFQGAGEPATAADIQALFDELGIVNIECSGEAESGALEDDGTDAGVVGLGDGLFIALDDGGGNGGKFYFDVSGTYTPDGGYGEPGGASLDNKYRVDLSGISTAAEIAAAFAAALEAQTTFTIKPNGAVVENEDGTATQPVHNTSALDAFPGAGAAENTPIVIDQTLAQAAGIAAIGMANGVNALQGVTSYDILKDGSSYYFTAITT